MIITEIYNHNHKMENTPIALKALFAALAIILAFASKSVIYHCCLFMLFFVLNKIITRVKIIVLIKLYALPLLFLLFSTVTIAINIDGNFKFYVSQQSIQMGVEVFCKSMAIISIVYLWMSTNTISEITLLMQKMRVPGFITELFVLTYKFIIALISITQILIIAQRCRLAYSLTKRNNRAASFLFAGVFVKSMDMVNQTTIAMNSRLCNNSFVFMQKPKNSNGKSLLVPIIVSPLLVILFFVI